MRLIDATDLVRRVLEERDKIRTEVVPRYNFGVAVPCQHGISMRGGIRKALREIETSPTIDAVQVVRCRNCKHFMEYTNQHRFESAFDGDCRLLAGYTDCDREKRRYMDYCSDGAKMDAEVKDE